MARPPIPTWFFVLVVVRKGHRFLVVEERKHGQRWYLPAGRVEPGESLVAAAVRETLEETGVPVQVDGILRIEHSPRSDTARLRVVFAASPTDDTPPKHEADDESLSAAWVSLEELDAMPLRSPEVATLFRYVASGGPVYPLDLLADESDPLPPRRPYR